VPRSTKELTLEQFAAELGGLPDELEGAIVRGLRSAAARGVSDVVESIQTTSPHAAVDTGALARSVEHSSLPRGGRINVDAPHAAPIENGTRPFWPPLQPLIDWAGRKFGVDEDEAEGIARAVQRKIAMFGIEPRHYFRRAMVRVRKRIPIEVESELRKI
jgi:hypothetical protein